MTFPTPYLLANPKPFAALLYGPSPILTIRKERPGEYGRYFLYHSSYGCLFDSGPLTPQELKTKVFKVRLRKMVGRVTVYYHHGYRSSDNQGSRSGYGRHPYNRSSSNDEDEYTFGGPDPASVPSRRKTRESVFPPGYRRKRNESYASNPRPSPETFSVFYEKVDESARPNYVKTVTTLSRVKYFRSWTGVRTPGYWKKKRRELPINDHSVSTWTVDSDINTVYSETLSGASKGQWGLTVDRASARYNVALLAPEPQHIVKAQDQALKNLIREAGNEIEANLAQDFAQIGQTLQLIENTVGRLTGAYRQVRRGNFSGAADTLYAGRRGRNRRTGKPSKSKSTASNWLEFQYGWKPLLMDVHGSMDSLAKLAYANNYFRYVTASGKSSSESNTNFAVVGQPQFGTPGKAFSRLETRTKYGLRFKVDSPLTAFLAQTGFTNPVNLAWEILPFSFVVDWFLPIGPWLETLSAWHGMSFIDGYRTTFTKQETALALAVNQPHPGNTTILWREDVRYTRNWVKLSRVRLSTFPVPAFPSWKNGVSPLHTANAIALFRTVFGS